MIILQTDFRDRLADVNFTLNYILVWGNLIVLALVAIIFLAAKFLYTVPLWIRRYSIRHREHQLLDDFNIDKELVKRDNKGMAVSFSGYLLGVGLVVRGSLSTQVESVADRLLAEVVFTGIGFFLLLLSSLINGFIIFRGIDNARAIMEGNISLGIMEAGTSFATGIIIGASITADGTNYGENIGATVLWWALGQFSLSLFSIVYELITKYDDKAEILKGNVAAGLGYAFTIVAISIMIASPISKSDSLLAWALNFSIGSIFLILMRLIVDKIVLRGRNLDREISEDQNWGAAIVEGFFVLGFAWVWESFLRLDLSANCIPGQAITTSNVTAVY